MGGGFNATRGLGALTLFTALKMFTLKTCRVEKHQGISKK